MRYFAVLVGGLVILFSSGAFAADVILSWTAPAVTSTQGTPTGYKIYKQTGSSCDMPGPLAGTGTAVGNVLTTTDTGLSEGTRACYEATATNAGGESPRSNRATVTIPLNPPGAPTLNAVIR